MENNTNNNNKHNKCNNHNKFKITMCPLSKRQIQLCAFMIRGGKRITPIRFCGYASPKLNINKYVIFAKL